MQTPAVGQRTGIALRAAGSTVAAAVVWWGALAPLAADTLLRAAVDSDYSGDPATAQALATGASQVAPWESVYQVEVGNTAFEEDHWSAARAAYSAAADLGTFNALVYRNLALADLKLGLVADARQAARKSVEIDPRDPANQALLAEFGAGKP